MGCDCCKMNTNNSFCKHLNEKERELAKKHGGCTATKAYRDNTCDVTFPEERKPGYGSNYTPPKKKRRKK